MEEKTTPKVSKKSIYPQLVINNNQHPNRLLAIPFIGLTIRLILVIPPCIVTFFLGIWFFIMWLILPFVILFTGKYWDAAYTFSLKYLKYSIKIGLYLYALTDKYPGFSLDDGGIFTLNYDKPTNPSRLLAFPVLGFFIRMILLIPYFVFMEVLARGAFVALFCSWFVILFKGRYPESMYEFISDTFRVSTNLGLYMAYMTDSYPSFHISMNHKIVKFILIILGALMVAVSFSSPSHKHTDNSYNYSRPASGYNY